MCVSSGVLVNTSYLSFHVLSLLILISCLFYCNFIFNVVRIISVLFISVMAMIGYNKLRLLLNLSRRELLLLQCTRKVGILHFLFLFHCSGYKIKKLGINNFLQRTTHELHKHPHLKKVVRTYCLF